MRVGHQSVGRHAQQAGGQRNLVAPPVEDQGCQAGQDQQRDGHAGRAAEEEREPKRQGPGNLQAAGRMEEG